MTRIVETSMRAMIREIKRKPSNVDFGLRVAIWICLTTFGIFMISQGGIWTVLGIILTGSMFAHGVELQHQALHHTGFASKSANMISEILLGLPLLVSYAGYQASHLRHHRDLGTPENKEFFDYGDQYGSSGRQELALWVKRLSIAAHYVQAVRSMGLALRGRPYEGESPRTSAGMRRDYLLMAALLAGGTAASALAGTPAILWYWLLPMLLVAGPVHALIEMPEHYGCDVQSTNPLANTRSLRSNALMTWFTNGNNFHVEHHLAPGLPMSCMREVHERIAETSDHVDRGYWDFYRRVLLRPRSRGLEEGAAASVGEG